MRFPEDRGLVGPITTELRVFNPNTVQIRGCLVGATLVVPHGRAQGPPLQRVGIRLQWDRWLSEQHCV